MDRRKFIKVGAAAAAAVNFMPLDSFAAQTPSACRKNKSPYSSEKGKATASDLKVRFLGTGAADWNGKDERGEQRRLSSMLIENKILMDFTPTDEDMLPKGVSPDTIFYTHSHSDHYNAAAALKAGVKKVYLSDTWDSRATREFEAAATELGLQAPEIVPMFIGQKAQVGDITITAMPGNHATGYDEEQALIYLIEKGDVRIIYATDTGGIPVRAARIAGIDAHIKGKPITGLIMEATMGIDYDEDYRIFTHSSVGVVKRTTDVLLSTGRLTAPEGQPVYLTHMARTLHGTQAELDATLPEPLRAAYDGLEVIFRA